MIVIIITIIIIILTEEANWKDKNFLKSLNFTFFYIIYYKPHLFRHYPISFLQLNLNNNRVSRNENFPLKYNSLQQISK
jgi:hypothetical protein